MTDTAELAQARIVAEVGDSGGIVAAATGDLWQSYADKALVAPRLQALYTKRDAIGLLLGHDWDSVDEGDGGATLRLSQRFSALLELQKLAQSQIETLEKQAASVSAPAIGVMTAIAPPRQPTTLPLRTGAPGGLVDALGRPIGWWPR